MENAWLARVAKLPSPRHAALPHQAADDFPTITQPRVEDQITPRADNRICRIERDAWTHAYALGGGLFTRSVAAGSGCAEIGGGENLS